MLKLFFYVLLVFLQSPVIQDINKDQATSLINDKVTVIDLRTEKEFENGKIGSSLNIDFQKREFIDNLNKLDKEKPYIIYCMSGNRSLKASHVMKSLGFKMIYHYKKGYKDWIKD
jgi:rhodanese-related sulfurtransferase